MNFTRQDNLIIIRIVMIKIITDKEGLLCIVGVIVTAAITKLKTTNVTRAIRRTVLSFLVPTTNQVIPVSTSASPE